MFNLSEETRRLVSYLRALEKGARCTYVELSQVAEMPIKSNTAKLTSARHILQRDHNQVWLCVRPGVGLQRLNDEEIAHRLPTWWMSGSRKKLVRGSRQADVVDLHQLNIDEQARFSVNSIQLALAQDALSKATNRKLEKVARGTSNDLPAFTAIEWAISLTPKRSGG